MDFKIGDKVRFHKQKPVLSNQYGFTYDTILTIVDIQRHFDNEIVLQFKEQNKEVIDATLYGFFSWRFELVKPTKFFRARGNIK